VETIDGDLCRLMIECLKKEESEVSVARFSGLSPGRWQAFLNLVTTHRVMPLLWYRPRQKGLDKVVSTPCLLRNFWEADASGTKYGFSGEGDNRCAIFNSSRFCKNIQLLSMPLCRHTAPARTQPEKIPEKRRPTQSRS
jgi:hypothetical protein